MSRSYTVAVALVLLTFASCATVLSPIPDSKESPVQAGTYSMEINACGVTSVETGACVFQTGAPVSGNIVIRVPRTNTSNTAATLELVSVECNYKATILGLPGQTVTVPVMDIMGTPAGATSCSVQVNMTAVWDKQSTFTFSVSPFVGRVLLLTLAHPATNLLTGVVFPVAGFVSYNEVAGSPQTDDLIVDTQGSVSGEILYDGCGIAPTTVPYRAANPALRLPIVNSSCILFGTVQPIDKPSSLSFAVAINSIPGTYLDLAPPALASASAGQSDPMVSAVDLGTTVAPGGAFTVPKSLRGTEYDIRQITTAGRFSISHVKNDAVTWSLP